MVWMLSMSIFYAKEKSQPIIEMGLGVLSWRVSRSGIDIPDSVVILLLLRFRC